MSPAKRRSTRHASRRMACPAAEFVDEWRLKNDLGSFMGVLKMDRDIPSLTGRVSRNGLVRQCQTVGRCVNDAGESGLPNRRRLGKPSRACKGLA
ncbi:hypothetical protein CBM2586_U20012 [Cupriavidus phytorum]|uniref:Uncharacterized protein n=1 Tax=Cupriavidus taiwanensis TaxID=164546 RepID=A0A375CT84_9BURK|nr:hypothetical protein CBM2586_U20012 [Cupriavidus taiwanensis]SPS02235.1 hypothetical protein CBM2634_P20020 [Cupriavidus taiwanensis]